jgi:hypothetical protein
MADFLLTSSLVKPSASLLGNLKRGIAGAAIDAGSPIYVDQADSKKLKLASAAGGLVDGVAVTTSGIGQPVLYSAEDPDFDLGVTVGSGQIIVLSQTTGKLCPDADVIAGSKVVLGVGKGGSKINLKFIAGGSL